MADNYIERKMEEYRMSNSSRKSMHRPVYGVRPGTVVLPYPMKKIVVTGPAGPVIETVVGAFRKADCRVALCCDDGKYGARVAQSTGARFYPHYDDCGLAQSLERIRWNGDKADAVVLWGCADEDELRTVSEYCKDIMVLSSGSAVRIEALSEAGIHVNNIVLPESVGMGEAWSDALSNLCLVLTMPGGEAIRGQRIHLCGV